MSARTRRAARELAQATTVSAPATLAAKIVLGPLLLWQGRRVRASALRMPEPGGERHGVVGNGAVALRILIVGDSSAAGVGVATQAEALAGQLAQALADRSGAAVGWQLVAQSGHTVADACAALRAARLAPADLLVTAVGVNDVVGQTRPTAFLESLDELHAFAAARAGITHTWHCGLPPMGTFPLLPQPLRWLLGRDAAHLDQALSRHLAGRPGRLHLPLPDAPAPSRPGDAMPAGWMAPDGFHPGPMGYRHWGRQVAEAIG